MGGGEQQRRSALLDLHHPQDVHAQQCRAVHGGHDGNLDVVGTEGTENHFCYRGDASEDLAGRRAELARFA